MHPDYKKIYTLLIERKFPNKSNDCKSILSKEELNIFDIQSLQKILFDKKNFKENQKLKAYDKETIIYILNYQKLNHLNNSELALYFKMSRNTIAKWHKQHDI